MLVGGHGEEAALVPSGTHAGEDTGRSQLVGDGIEHIFIGIAGCIVQEIEEFPDLARGQHNTE